MTARARVFTIPSYAPFLPTLAEALLNGRLIPGFAPRGDPLALSSATVYLPTRRATRAFSEALLAALGTEATLLPRIVPLGDADEDALAFAESDAPPERPAPVSTAERRLVLASLVAKFAKAAGSGGDPIIASTPAAALQLADELARLFDDMTIAGVSFDALDEDAFVPAELDQYWKKSLEFLKLARPAWEAFLAERALVDPVVWRDKLLEREASRLAAGGGGPVIAAGSTGTIPAVAKLIATIAHRADGAVVLPGLDQELDDASFALVEGGEINGLEIEPSPGHPQFGLKRLIARIGVGRGEIERLGEPVSAGREKLLSEAFRPAATTDRWRQRDEVFEAAAGHALEEISLVEAADPREEALAIAIALRETLETPHAQAALITPDRALARRVAAELRRWDVAVDDSAGIALADSEAGRLARLAATAAAEQLAPVPLLALLRHPLLGARIDRRAVDALEIAVLRGPRPAPGGEGLLRALEETHEQALKEKLHRRDARMKLGDVDWAIALALARQIGTELAPLLRLYDAAEVSFAELLQAHRDSLRALGVNLAEREDEWFERHGLRGLAAAFEQFAVAARDAAPLTLAGYADAFGALLAGEPPMRPPFDRGARIRILGPLEARLLESDRVVLGGLNEGTWPPETHADAWLSRPMRKKLKLDLPERRIGLTAHDFAQAATAPEVLFTRARKADGVETVASRFLQRLAAVAPEQAWEATGARGARYLGLARVLEQPGVPAPVKRPAPAPPAEARPARLSVTEIETLIRDPYSIYARHVLRLAPLDEIDADPGAAERGTVLHEAFGAFAEDFPDALPAQPLRELLARGEAAFARRGSKPGMRALWWRRFVRAAEWFIGDEAQRRQEVARILSETDGRISFDAGGRPFTLSARADRIDRRKDGSAAIADYKSGAPPTLPQILSGLAPQLALEAAILRAGGFEGIPKDTPIAEIAVIRISGGQPPGEWCVLDVTKARGEAAERAKELGIDSADRLAIVSRELLEVLIAKFAEAATPYLSIPRPKWRGRFGQYDHLARIKEWSANEEGAE